jgi:gamma-glutamyltranspeptidase / glutathione hydrolase
VLGATTPTRTRSHGALSRYREEVDAMTQIERSYQDVHRRPACGDAVAVAAARRESVDAALAMLEAGGNAADAAVACGFVAGVVEPMETCLVRSGFLLAWEPAGARATAVDFPPRAPLAAREDMFEVVPSRDAARLLGVSAVRDDANTEGILAPGVPGTVAGLLAAHERLGRLPRRQVLEPAIRAAADGFAVDGYYALEALDHLDALRAHPDAAATYLDGRELPPVPAFLGDATLGTAPLLRQPQLARTLEVVAEHGEAGFYAGEIAVAIERHFAEHGGLLTREDLAAYRPLVREPLRVRYRGVELFAPVSPCGAWTELQILRTLERVGLRGTAVADADALHAVIAASRRAFADRYHWLGDPDHIAVPLRGLLSDGYADEAAAAIRGGDRGPAFDSPDGFPWERLAFDAAGDPWPHHDEPNRRPEYRPTSPARTAPERHGTTHFAVVDGDGMMVSCTHTAGNAFGSKVVAHGTGLLFDAAMVWFNAVPGAANSIAPAKRPLVNMGPLLVVDGGRARLTVGAPGGRRIIDAVVQVLISALDRDLPLQDAIDAPRIDASGSAVLASERLADEALDSLRSRGHDVVAIREQHAPFSYELARPAGVEIAPDGQRRTGVASLTQGHAAAW